MNVAEANPYGMLRIVNASNRSALSRRAASGAAIRLAPGIYVEGSSARLTDVANHHLYAIVAAIWPGAVLCGSTALCGGRPENGMLFISRGGSGRKARLSLPGVSIVAVDGPGRLPGDMEMPERLFLSGPARSLVENITLRGRPSVERAGTRAVEDRIDALARQGGPGALRRVLEQLDDLGSEFDPRAVDLVRHQLVALLGSFSVGRPDPQSRRLLARLDGAPYDDQRIGLLEGLVSVLRDRAPQPRPLHEVGSHFAWQPFFEAYFSNFIEGTEFGVDEARRIAIDEVVPVERPQDAHDVSATFRLAADPVDRSLRPRSGRALIDVLMSRHRTLMAARPELRPGRLKDRRNFAGGYEFVTPELVEGTLITGFDVVDQLTDAFARAVAMMALITECHPFDDGNGRIARLTANAELSSAGEARITIPTVYRNDYLAALAGFSRGVGRGESLISVLEFAQRWTLAVDWTTFERANRELQLVNAYLDPGIAEASGRRLQLPHQW